MDRDDVITMIVLEFQAFIGFETERCNYIKWSYEMNTAVISIANISGYWSLTRIIHTFADGRTQSSFEEGDGVLVLEASGRFCQALLRSDLPRIASGNRGTVSHEESTAIIEGSLTLFGTWRLNDEAITFRIERSSFPNWKDTDQTRIITSLSKTEMTITASASTLGARGDQTWKRIT
jgi:hypothetical protein